MVARTGAPLSAGKNCLVLKPLGTLEGIGKRLSDLFRRFRTRLQNMVWWPVFWVSEDFYFSYLLLQKHLNIRPPPVLFLNQVRKHQFPFRAIHVFSEKHVLRGFVESFFVFFLAD